MTTANQFLTNKYFHYTTMCIALMEIINDSNNNCLLPMLEYYEEKKARSYEILGGNVTTEQLETYLNKNVWEIGSGKIDSQLVTYFAKNI